MDLSNKTPQEIQQYIFDEIGRGVDPVKLKFYLREKGIAVEGYYFTSETAHDEEMSKPVVPGGKPSWPWILGVVIIVLFLGKCVLRSCVISSQY